MIQKNKIIFKNLIAPAIIVFIITIAYLPTFSGEFILDDHPLVEGNPYIKKLQSFESYFLQEDGILPHNKIDEYHTGYYRPLINITYFIDYQLWGMKAAGFRSTNLIFHITTCLFLYLALAKSFGGILLPAASALLFGLHPVNTEAVAWVASRNNIMVSLFSLASFYFYVKRSHEKAMWHTSLSLLFFGMALFSKEFGVMLLPIFFLYDRLLGKSRGSYKKDFRGYLPFVAILMVYFIMRYHALLSVLAPAGTESMLKRFYFAPYLMMHNLRLLFQPYGLHSFVIGYPESLLNWPVMLSFIGLVMAGLILWRFRMEKMLVFSLLAFSLGIFPVLNILKTSAVSLISMRWLYFPLMFLMFFFCWLLERFTKWNKYPAVVLISSILVLLGGYSFFLNQYQWRDDGSLFHREVIEFKNLAYAGGLAEKYHDTKDYRSAYKYYILAIQNLPRQPQNYINFATLLTDLKRPEQALAYLDRAKKLKMNRKMKGQMFNNQGMALVQLGRLEEAVSSLSMAVKLAPDMSEFWTNLGAAYGIMEDYDKSIAILKLGLELAGDSLALTKNLGISYIRAGRYEDAIRIFEGIQAKGQVRDKGITALLKQAYEGYSKK